MAETPEPECVLEVDQFLGQLVQVPVSRRIAVDRQPGLGHGFAFRIGLGPVALQVAVGNCQAAPGHQAQRFVVQGRRLVGRLHQRQQFRAMRMRLEHGGILVAQRELDAAVLVTLESARLTQRRPHRRVFGRRHRGQHVPGVHQLLHDARDPRQHLEAAGEFVAGHATHGAAELVQHQLHPQLAGLVLHDEQHLVMRRRQRLLRRQDLVELQVVAITHGAAEVELGLLLLDDLFGRRRTAGLLLHAHSITAARARATCSTLSVVSPETHSRPEPTR